jgi:ketosteroid isomerase-like protein
MHGKTSVGVAMPWFPDFVSAVELARLQTRAAGLADPVAAYLAALDRGDSHALEAVWPGEIVVYDPRAGQVRGHEQLHHFVSENQRWLAERHARIDAMAAVSAGGRAVVEMLAHLLVDGVETAWPIAVVAESVNERSVEFRTYCSQLPVDGRRHLRPSILTSGTAAPGDVIARYLNALAAGDAGAVVETFDAGDYLRLAFGPDSTYQGPGELMSYFTDCFGDGGGIDLQSCVVTDDGVRCAVEYNCVRWGRHDVAPQAGIGVYERGPDGLLSAVRFYDDVAAPGH